MKLNNKVYDALKWIVMIVIPAMTTAYVGLAAIWGFPFAEEVAKTSSVICALQVCSRFSVSGRTATRK